MKETNNDTRIRRDWKLIRQYADNGSQAAFAELTTRYINLVYSICLRETGQPQMAEDAAQAVFLVLAKKMKELRPGTVLARWFFEVSRLTCKNALREQRRHEARDERAAQNMLQQSSSQNGIWDEIEPHLHEAIATLNHRDQELLLLRYFEDQSLRDVGRELGLSEDAARMRLNRALTKLRSRLVRQGIVVAVASLGALLAEHSVQAAPVEFANHVVSQGTTTMAAVAKSSVSFLTKGALKTMLLMKWTTITATSLAGIVLVATVGGNVLQTAKITAQTLPATQSASSTSAHDDSSGTAQGAPELPTVQYQALYKVPDFRHDGMTEEGILKFTVSPDNKVQWSTFSTSVGESSGEGTITYDAQHIGHIIAKGVSSRGWLALHTKPFIWRINGMLTSDKVLIGKFDTDGGPWGDFTSVRQSGDMWAQYQPGHYEGSYSVTSSAEIGVFKLDISADKKVQWSTISSSVGSCSGDGIVTDDGHIIVMGHSIRGDEWRVRGIIAGTTINGKYMCMAGAIGPYSASLKDK